MLSVLSLHAIIHLSKLRQLRNQTEEAYNRNNQASFLSCLTFAGCGDCVSDILSVENRMTVPVPEELLQSANDGTVLRRYWEIVNRSFPF